MNGIMGGSQSGNKIEGIKKHITKKKKGDGALVYESRFKKAIGLKEK